MAIGLEMIPDGQFGPVTDRAVTEFKGQQGLGPDGIVGVPARPSCSTTDPATRADRRYARRSAAPALFLFRHRLFELVLKGARFVGIVAGYQDHDHQPAAVHFQALHNPGGFFSP